MHENIAGTASFAFMHTCSHNAHMLLFSFLVLHAFTDEYTLCSHTIVLTPGCSYMHT
jgi:hypothetical protein